MPTIKAYSVKDVVVCEVGGSQQRFVGMNVHRAHELVTELLEAIDSANGFDDAMSGRVRTYVECRDCGRRGITPSHVCKRGTPRTGK